MVERPLFHVHLLAAVRRAQQGVRVVVFSVGDTEVLGVRGRVGVPA